MARTITHFAKRPTDLGRHVAELNRIDTAIVAAARTGTPFPSLAIIFGALSDASIASAEVLENCGATPVPVNVRNNLLGLQCSVTDVVASLMLYTTLAVTPMMTVEAAQQRRIEANLEEIETLLH
jgi:hypothetical protein